MKYELTGPCRNCPFRNDTPTYLRAERAEEISDSLMSGSTFPCHKTVDYTSSDEDTGDEGADDDGEGADDDGEGRLTERSQSCGGAMATMERNGFANQMMRIAERLGLYDANKIDPAAPVYSSLHEWVEAHA